MAAENENQTQQDQQVGFGDDLGLDDFDPNRIPPTDQSGNPIGFDGFSPDGGSSHQYRVVGTHETYIGRVVTIGQDLFTTSGGSLEGNSVMVEQTNIPNSIHSPNNDKDIITKFIVGISNNHEFYHPIYSIQTYYF